jgi:hypothetical protein
VGLGGPASARRAIKRKRVDRDPTLGPLARIAFGFGACNRGTAAEIGVFRTDNAVLWDTNRASCRGRDAIGFLVVVVRHRWRDAIWSVDTGVAEPSGSAAAIAWTMRGSEHYALRDNPIAEVRQYGTCDSVRLDTGLVDWKYPPQAS